jgi:hypothetical protein
LILTLNELAMSLTRKRWSVSFLLPPFSSSTSSSKDAGYSSSHCEAANRKVLSPPKEDSNDQHSRTDVILVVNGTDVTVSFIGPQYGLNQEFVADLYNVKIENQIPTICVRPHESLAERVRETMEKFSGVRHEM